MISDVEGALEKARQVMGNGTVGGSTFDQVRSLVESLGGEKDEDVDVSRASTSPIDSSSDTDCPIHIPIWVEKRASVKATGPVDPPATSLLVIAPANAGLVAELVTILPKFATRFLVSVVGNAAKEIASQFADPCVIAVDLADGQNLADGQGTPVLRQIDEFEADVVTVVQAIDCWDLSESLSTVASDNSLCEFLFLVAQRNIQRLKLGRVELWGLFVDGWKGVVHPLSGAVAGLLKSVHREIPASRVGSICTRGLALSDTLQKLFAERLQTDPEHEIVYDENVRLVRRLRRASDGLPPSPQVKLDSNSVVIATGGAKGVTAVMLEAILRDHQCTVIAFGRSPLEAGPENCNDVAVEQEFYRQFMKENPNASALEMKARFESTRARWEAHQTIQKLDSLGGNVEYMVVDVTERDHIARAVQQIASRYGRVDFLIHGAGVQVSKRLEHRSIAEFQKTYSVKVSGLANLVKCCQAELAERSRRTF